MQIITGQILLLLHVLAMANANHMQTHIKNSMHFIIYHLTACCTDTTIPASAIILTLPPSPFILASRERGMVYLMA